MVSITEDAAEVRRLVSPLLKFLAQVLTFHVAMSSPHKTLKAQCKRNGLSTAGSIAVLQARLNGETADHIPLSLDELHLMCQVHKVSKGCDKLACVVALRSVGVKFENGTASALRPFRTEPRVKSEGEDPAEGTATQAEVEVRPDDEEPCGGDGIEEEGAESESKEDDDIVSDLLDDDSVDDEGESGDSSSCSLVNDGPQDEVLPSEVVVRDDKRQIQQRRPEDAGIDSFTIGYERNMLRRPAMVLSVIIGSLRFLRLSKKLSYVDLPHGKISVIRRAL